MSGLFDNLRFKIGKPIRLIEFFGGIGSQAMALRNIGADFEHYRLVEFDKYAVASYNAIHHTDFTRSDIRNIHGDDLGIVEKDKFTYLLTYSFPCTDLSVAGKMKGMSKADWEAGKSTRSGLLWEVERILEECKELPQVLLMENVAQVHGKKNLADFNLWIDFLKSKGYQNFWQDLNAKDYGIPQNRVRCFMVSILADGYVDYEFPEKTELKKVMKDLLEDSVDEKYYINSEKADKLLEELIKSGVLENDKKQTSPNFLGNFYGYNCGYDGSVFGINAPCKTITHSKGGVADIVDKWVRKSSRKRSNRMEVKIIGKMDNTIDHTYESANRVYDKNSLCPTIPTIAGGGQQPKIIEETHCVEGLTNKQWGKQYHHQDRVYKGDIALAQPANLSDGSYKYIVAMRGRGENNEQRLELNKNGTTNALTTVQKDNLVLEKPRYRIRKLTPRECWRLMGFSDADFDKASAVNNNTQLYKQAGNSIVVNVLMGIFSQML